MLSDSKAASAAPADAFASLQPCTLLPPILSALSVEQEQGSGAKRSSSTGGRAKATSSHPNAASAQPEAACKVPIADLLRDKRFQVRQRIDPVTVARYAHVISNGIEMPPVTVALVDGVPVVVDGWHRIEAHEQRGFTVISAIFVEAAESEAQWLAAKANMAHGLPLKPREIRVAFRAFIRARRHLKPVRRRGDTQELLSYRDIARELGGAMRHTTIRNWMKDDFPKIAKRMGGEEGPGSNEQPATVDPQDVFAATAMGALQDALVAARGVQDPERRGAIIAAAESVLRAMRDGGPWVVPMPLEF